MMRLMRLKFWSKKIYQTKPGVTLMEVLVSVTIFVILMLSATEIFQMVLVGQRYSLANQNLQENIKYFFEVVSKEVRMAQRNSGGVCGSIPSDRLFATSTNAYGDILYLQNYHGECVSYYLNSVDGQVRFMVSRDGVPAYLTPKKVQMLDLGFVVVEEVGTQPYVVVNILAEATLRADETTELRLQTTIGSRYYKN